MATITGKLENILGTIEDGTIDIALWGYGSQIPRASGTGLIAKPDSTEIEVNSDGTFEQELTGNDQIAPAGTYYTITARDKNGDVVQINAYIFLGDNTYDLDVTDPFDPSQPIPPLPPLIINQLEILAPADNMVFDGTDYTAFKTTLPGNVSNPVFQNMVPGNLYTFIIVQDATGGHTFAWPSNVHNATLVDPAPNSTTIETFVADEGGSLWAIGPGTWML